MAPPAVVVDNITRRFGRRTALAGVSFTLDPHECLAIFGPNGAGKTTLLKIVAGLLAPNSGSVSPFGLAARSAVGLISHQTMLYPELTALENVELPLEVGGGANRLRTVLSAGARGRDDLLVEVKDAREISRPDQQQA